MPVAEKAHRTKDLRKLISVSAEEVSQILIAVKKIDPNAHIVDEAPLSEKFITPKNSKWYHDIKDNWHPGITLRIRRQNVGYTQAQLAKITGLAIANISAIENGRRSMGLIVAKKISEALNRPIVEFIEKEPELYV